MEERTRTHTKKMMEEGKQVLDQLTTQIILPRPGNSEPILAVDSFIQLLSKKSY